MSWRPLACSLPNRIDLFPLSPGAQDVRVRVLPEVRGRLGGTVELPCHLLPPTTERVSQVTWQRLDGTVVAAFHPSFGVDFPNSHFNKERLSFVKARPETNADLRDATLAFRGLRVEDEGNYTCEFATFPNGTRRGVTWLRVIGEWRGPWLLRVPAFRLTILNVLANVFCFVEVCMFVLGARGCGMNIMGTTRC